MSDLWKKKDFKLHDVLKGDLSSYQAAFLHPLEITDSSYQRSSKFVHTISDIDQEMPSA